MKKNRNSNGRHFKGKNIIIAVIILGLIFTGALYKLADKFDAGLAKAEDVINQNIDDTDDTEEIYVSYDLDSEEFNKEIEEIEEAIGVNEQETKADNENNENEANELGNEEAENIVDKDVEKLGNVDNTEETDDEKVEGVSIETEEKENAAVLPEETAPENEKVAYITFDDGPSSSVTPQILDILKEYDIKATFFVLGKNAEDNPDILKRIYEEGHVIGNHSYSHNYSYIYKNMSNFMDEIERTEEVFKSILGEEFKTDLFRFPGGSFEDWKKPFREQIVELGYRYVDWNSLNGDAEGHNLSKEQLVKRLKATYRNQKKLIILMHDTDAKPTTADALPEIIEFLIEKGYKFATF